MWLNLIIETFNSINSELRANIYIKMVKGFTISEIIHLELASVWNFHCGYFK